MSKEKMNRRIDDINAQVDILQEMRDRIMKQTTTIEEFEIAKMMTAKIDELLAENVKLMKEFFAA